MTTGGGLARDTRSIHIFESGTRLEEFENRGLSGSTRDHFRVDSLGESFVMPIRV